MSSLANHPFASSCSSDSGGWEQDGMWEQKIGLTRAVETSTQAGLGTVDQCGLQTPKRVVSETKFPHFQNSVSGIKVTYTTQQKAPLTPRSSSNPSSNNSSSGGRKRGHNQIFSISGRIRKRSMKRRLIFADSLPNSDILPSQFLIPPMPQVEMIMDRVTGPSDLDPNWIITSESKRIDPEKVTLPAMFGNFRVTDPRSGSVLWRSNVMISDWRELRDAIKFDGKRIQLFPDATSRPKKGEGLNLPTRVTVFNVNAKNENKMRKILMDACKSMGTKFVSFRDSKWVMDIEFTAE